MNCINPCRLIGGVRACRKLMLATVLLVLSGFASAVSAQSSFYDGPRSLLPGQPGSLVRQEPIDGAPLPSASTRPAVVQTVASVGP